MSSTLAPQTVTRLTVEQFKRITDVEIIPDTDTPTVQITGRNAQGKSSVLDALEAVFAGVDNRRTPKPIHEGSNVARIVAETDDLLITRTFKEGAKGVTSTLTVAARDGAKYSSPQKMLDELYGQVTVDPWAFATMPAKDQRATLLSLVELPFDLDALESKRAELFARRTEENRAAKALTTRLEAAQEGAPADGANTREVSADDLIDRIQEARQHAEAVERATRLEAEVSKEIEDLQARLRDARERLVSAVQEQERLEQVKAEDAEVLREQLRNQERINQEARANRAAFEELERLEAEESAALSKVGETNLALQDIDARKDAGLAAARFPVAGLAFSADGITYQGQPFEQASTAERIRVSFAVATAKPGTMRVVLIRNGESLDRENLALIGELAAEAGFQVWVERVSEVRELGVFQLEDGRLAE